MLEHLRNMKIRARLLLSYAVIIAICLTASTAALFMLNKIGNNLTSFYDNNYTVTVNVWMAKREMQAARADILNAILDSDMDDTKASVANAHKHLGNMRSAFPVIRETFKGDIGMVDQVDSLLERAILGSMSEGDFRVRTQSEEYYRGQYNRILVSMRGLRVNLNRILMQIGYSAKQV